MDTAELLRRLAPLALRDTRHAGYGDKFAFISAFVARRTEVFQTIAMPVAGLLLVLEGTKQIGWAGRRFTYSPGEAFSLPAGTEVDVVNEPDPATGMYRALFLGFSTELLDDARRKWSALAKNFLGTDPTIKIVPALATAILHTSEALAGVVAVSPLVTELRLQEVLLILAEAGAAPLRPDLKTCSMTQAVRMLVRNDLAKPWTAAEIAAALCTTQPTLRRRLAQAGTGFREILAQERMSAARCLLLEGHANVAEAAVAGGYSSLSHFTKRFRTVYGHLPSQAASLRP